MDYIIVGFKGSNFDGTILNKLADAVDKKIIRVVDMVFIIKDKKGQLTEGEYEDQSPELLDTFGSVKREDDLPLLTDADIAHIGEQMESDTAAAALVFEHLWAKDIKQAMLDAGGLLIDRGHIQETAVDRAIEELAKQPTEEGAKK